MSQHQYSETDLRWALAAGYTMEDMAALTRQEMEEFDTLVFRRHGPDQVTYGVEQEERYNTLLAKIEGYSK